MLCNISEVAQSSFMENISDCSFINHIYTLTKMKKIPLSS